MGFGGCSCLSASVLKLLQALCRGTLQDVGGDQDAAVWPFVSR